MAATFFYGVGLISLVIHSIRGGFVNGFIRYIVFIGTLVFVAVPAIPSGWGLYGESLAAIGVFFPISWGIANTS